MEKSPASPMPSEMPIDETAHGWGCRRCSGHEQLQRFGCIDRGISRFARIIAFKWSRRPPSWSVFVGCALREYFDGNH